MGPTVPWVPHFPYIAHCTNEGLELFGKQKRAHDVGEIKIALDTFPSYPILD